MYQDMRIIFILIYRIFFPSKWNDLTFLKEFSSHQKYDFVCNVMKTSLHYSLHDGRDYQLIGLLMMLNEHSLLKMHLSSNRYIDFKKPNPFLLHFSFPSCSQIITKTHCGLTCL